MLKKILLGLGLLLIAIQFIRPAKNLSPTPGPRDLFALHPAPPAVKQLIGVACYDCHSNNTRYPWYAEVQPAAWWLASHVRDAKLELNFSEFGAYSAKKAVRRLDACIDEITDRAMPLSSYRLIHRDARLDEAQVKLLTDWLDEIREGIAEGAGQKPAASVSAP